MRISVHIAGKLVKALKDRGNKTEKCYQHVKERWCECWYLQELVYAVLPCEENSQEKGREDVFRDFFFLYLKPDGCTWIL